MNLKNASEQFLLDTVVRPMWSVAEQLLGAGTVIWPAGEDERGLCTGPSFLSDEVVEGLGTHQGKSTHGSVDITDKATADGFDWDGNWAWEVARAPTPAHWADLAECLGRPRPVRHTSGANAA